MISWLVFCQNKTGNTNDHKRLQCQLPRLWSARSTHCSKTFHRDNFSATARYYIIPLFHYNCLMQEYQTWVYTFREFFKCRVEPSVLRSYVTVADPHEEKHAFWPVRRYQSCTCMCEIFTSWFGLDIQLCKSSSNHNYNIKYLSISKMNNNIYSKTQHSHWHMRHSVKHSISWQCQLWSVVVSLRLRMSGARVRALVLYL